MLKISRKHQKILGIFLEKGEMQSSKIHTELVYLGEDISLVTVKRMLSEMVEQGLLVMSGAGRAVSYGINVVGRLFTEIDAHKYFALEPDKRYGLGRYNFELLPALTKELFSDAEIKKLNEATVGYKQRLKDISPTLQKKELERLIIELSWKSSKIEGNTYTLLDTEKLILENKEAPGHDKKETNMILNHKDAFNFVLKNSAQYKIITKKNLEELHSILVKNLSIELGLRKKPVGVIGSIFKPLDNIYQITEAINILGEVMTRATSSYDKALIALLGIGYIQPFEDGNKRTARLMANAILLAHGCAPLSYRSVDEYDFREAMLAFYEVNSLMSFKKIFIDQYIFAAQNYIVK